MKITTYVSWHLSREDFDTLPGAEERKEITPSNVYWRKRLVLPSLCTEITAFCDEPPKEKMMNYELLADVIDHLDAYRSANAFDSPPDLEQLKRELAMLARELDGEITRRAEVARTSTKQAEGM